jgi:NAD-dependent deacetylase
VEDKIKRAAQWIKNSRHLTVFTGSGISVESGIPPFRGEGGLWDQYDPRLADISYFRAHPEKSWAFLKEVFYDHFGHAEPNDAHKGIVELEKMGLAKAVITQNVDHLHQDAGSKTVYEFHGTSRTLSCMLCGCQYDSRRISMEVLPPRCSGCMGMLKPDFVFFGEPIPKEANMLSFYEAQIADVFLVIGTTGEVMPACQVPIQARDNGARVIEINLEPSNFTPWITDVFLQGKATEVMNALVREAKKCDRHDKENK